MTELREIKEVVKDIIKEVTRTYLSYIFRSKV